MNIKDNRKAGSHKFNELRCGEVFVDHASNFYIKTPSVTKEDSIFNAFCLTDGKYSMFFCEEMVTPVKAVLTIEDKI